MSPHRSYSNLYAASSSYPTEDEVRPLLDSSFKSSEWRVLLHPDSGEPFSLYPPKAPMDPPKPISITPKKNSSLVTIFAIWNTMMGTSLLAMPWGIERAGLFLGTVLVILMGGLCLYTAYSNLKVHEQFGNIGGEVSELCSTLLGRSAEKLSKVFSMLVLFGALLVYYILMSNFFYNSVFYVYQSIYGLRDDQVAYNTTPDTMVCPKDVTIQIITKDKSLFETVWNLEITVPLFLVLLIGPLLNFKSPTFFTKFNSLGTFSVAYLLIFVITKAVTWGVNLSFDESSPSYTPMAKFSFPATSGMLALSYFMHNIIITVMSSNANPKNNGRDLTIAYGLVTLTYSVVGFLFYITFPLAKTCIADNLLNNFTGWEVMTVIGRIFLLFQLTTVFPLIAYMLRVETLKLFTGDVYPGLIPVLSFNSFVITACVLTAIFLPKIGTIIRFTGAASGFVHIFTLPILLKLAAFKKNGRLNTMNCILNLAVPIIGILNLLGQFFVSDS